MYIWCSAVILESTCSTAYIFQRNIFAYIIPIVILEKLFNHRTCEICGSIAHNVHGANDAELAEQLAESNDATSAAATAASSNSADTRHFWQGHRFLNFLLACMVFAFVISWLFHFNVPSWEKEPYMQLRYISSWLMGLLGNDVYSDVQFPTFSFCNLCLQDLDDVEMYYLS